jgi:hypothetical protein
MHCNPAILYHRCAATHCLRCVLCCCAVPSVTFPPVRMFGNFDNEVIEQRRQAFQVWLDAITEHRELWPALATWLEVPLEKWKL